ncbi:hypothetical protein PAXRUDRAFT_830364 [Paxillus rubicundulus Ve08.2h10]|uniref:Uncharacterized protein n=1 Tax=Paxillus rubicundulus Ve08.2h10 TaxID=930991 RepID=A0A0D0D5N9_9AGAM|nr:hypothetical protein PAXRUDRAFT_830364 [Paxillus rubicundulus Ve08.2h10]
MLCSQVLADLQISQKFKVLGLFVPKTFAMGLFDGRLEPSLLDIIIFEMASSHTAGHAPFWTCPTISTT